jgi:ABC-2 type transport system permease protein
MIGWLFAPFSAIYYPLDALPTSAQLIGKCIPMTYVFEAMRTKIKTGIIAWDQLAVSYLLNFIFLAVSLLFFWYMYNARKEIGLTRLE